MNRVLFYYVNYRKNINKHQFRDIKMSLIFFIFAENKCII